MKLRQSIKVLKNTYSNKKYYDESTYFRAYDSWNRCTLKYNKSHDHAHNKTLKIVRLYRDWFKIS